MASCRDDDDSGDDDGDDDDDSATDITGIDDEPLECIGGGDGTAEAVAVEDGAGLK